MIRRNVDAVAIAILLALMALYSQAREAMVLQLIPNQGIVVSSDLVHRVLGECPETTPVRPLPSLAFYH